MSSNVKRNVETKLSLLSHFYYNSSVLIFLLLFFYNSSNQMPKESMVASSLFNVEILCSILIPQVKIKNKIKQKNKSGVVLGRNFEGAIWFIDFK